MNNSSKPVFVLGITRRSGTNFLMELLALHPDLASTKFINEDFMLSEAHWLFQYAHKVHSHWNPRWGVDSSQEALLLQHLGQSMVSCLASSGNGKRLVTKTPSVENLSYFFDLFPNAYLLILVRDGRDVVESMVRSFKWGYEKATRNWALAAQTIVDFDQRQHELGSKYLIVKYEDLVLDLDNQLRIILEFLDLDVSTYNFETAHQLPVFGSSMVQDEAEQKWHWKSVARTREFQPLKRWQSWGPYRRQRFHWLAGPLMVELGYEEKGAQPSWPLYNRLIDLTWSVGKKFSGLIPKRVKRDFKARQWV